MGSVFNSKVVTIHRLQNAEAIPVSAPPIDIVTIRGETQPFFVENGMLKPHPAHVDRTHSTVVHVSRRQSEEIQWRSPRPFSIHRITDHDTNRDARPFPWDCPKHSVSENGMHVLASNLPEPGADGGREEGKLYKAWFKFEDETGLLDPDFSCDP